MCLAVPAKIIEIFDDELAKADMNGVKIKVATALFSDDKVDDYVLIHAGFIIEKISDEDAKERLELFEEIQKLDRDNR